MTDYNLCFPASPNLDNSNNFTNYKPINDFIRYKPIFKTKIFGILIKCSGTIYSTQFHQKWVSDVTTSGSFESKIVMTTATGCSQINNRFCSLSLPFLFITRSNIKVHFSKYWKQVIVNELKHNRDFGCLWLLCFIHLTISVYIYSRISKIPHDLLTHHLNRTLKVSCWKCGLNHQCHLCCMLSVKWQIDLFDYTLISWIMQMQFVCSFNHVTMSCLNLNNNHQDVLIKIWNITSALHEASLVK